MIDKKTFCTAQVCTKMHNKNIPYFDRSPQDQRRLAVDLPVRENTRICCAQVTGGKPARRGGKGYTSNIGKLAAILARCGVLCVVCG